MRIRWDSNYLLPWEQPCFWLCHSWLWLLFKGGSLNNVFNFEKENASWGEGGGQDSFVSLECLRRVNCRQRCKFIHEPAISFISGSLSMNQQSHSLFTRPLHLAILFRILLFCHTLPYIVVPSYFAISHHTLTSFAISCCPTIPQHSNPSFVHF